MTAVYLSTSPDGRIAVRAPFEEKEYLKAAGGRWNKPLHAWLISPFLREEICTHFRRRGFVVEAPVGECFCVVG